MSPGITRLCFKCICSVFKDDSFCFHFMAVKKKKKRKEKHQKTYFKLIKVISAILSGQTLHYAGHWRVAQTRPCKVKICDSCMTKRQTAGKSVCSSTQGSAYAHIPPLVECFLWHSAVQINVLCSLNKMNIHGNEVQIHFTDE